MFATFTYKCERCGQLVKKTLTPDNYIEIFTAADNLLICDDCYEAEYQEYMAEEAEWQSRWDEQHYGDQEPEYVSSFDADYDENFARTHEPAYYGTDD